MKREEKSALNIIGSEKNAEGIISLLKDVLSDYAKKPDSQTLNEWVYQQFKKYSDDFENEDKLKEDANSIVSNIEVFNQNREELTQTLAEGKSKESWVARKIEEGAKASNIVNIGNYANEIEDALEYANVETLNTFLNLDGSINNNKNLHGFVAENHHVNSFNIDAATSGSDFRAEMLESTSKNSVDIVIRDVNGKIVKKYGAKYGQNAKDTQKYLDKGDYRGQQKLVADGQEREILNSTNRIEHDNVKSEPLSYEESRKKQKEIQKQEYIEEYNWDKVNKTKFTKNIVKETGKSVAIHVLIQAGRIFGHRIWNSMTGKKNKDINVDLKEWFDSSWIGAKAIGIQTAVTTALTIAVRKGLITGLAKNTPVGKIANIVYVGIENAKVMYKMAKGEISFKEGVKEMEKVTLSAVGGIVGATEGAVIGASLGSVVPVVGTAIGGFIGAVIGGMAGSAIGELMAQGFQKVRSVVMDKMSKAYSNSKRVVSDVVEVLRFGVLV